MRCSAVLCKQTLHPPRHTAPLASKPLTRWSCHLPKWTELSGSLTPVRVGLEGCHSAFNATNSIRTCLYFQTAAPPTFLTASSWRSIEHVQLRESDEAVRGTTPASATPTAASPFDGIALFGESEFFAGCPTSGQTSASGAAAQPGCALVAVENFADRAQSVLRTRLPTSPAVVRGGGGLRLVVGHENCGVRRSLLRPRPTSGTAPACPAPPVADEVVYVPQYGTISSLNVVTSLGIALFYSYMDAACPHARVIHSAPSSAGVAHATGVSAAAEEELRTVIAAYQNLFSRSLPAPAPCADTGSAAAALLTDGPPRAALVPDAHVNTTPRVDHRPLHPVFYSRTVEEIQALQRSYRHALLSYSHACSSAPAPSFFGLSVLYENEFDQRNFGGLIRSANAFLVDHIFYVGRRKVNVVGAVGSYHYTPPVHLGSLPSTAAAAATATAAADDSDDTDGAAHVYARVKEAYASAPPRHWWMLDCGHEFMYSTASPSEGADAVAGESTAAASSSSAASLRAYARLKADGHVHSLCETESALREALAGGLVLLIPQEGRLPHPALMRLCTGVLTVLPHDCHYDEGGGAVGPGGSTQPGHRGLPSQVASGIALQRLSAVLHPRLAAL
ncbi:hypothetical protein NESM_000024200 [Novymonas esmeraldas]|uniref:Uncharacterized protein n=1 Tax=Novymonas esmeraldas TaxID=1808958 RepID=A0AAW0F067_9TRYP